MSENMCIALVSYVRGFYCGKTVYHQLRGLNRHPFLHTSPVWVVLRGAFQAEVKVLAVFLSGGSGEKSASKFIQVVGQLRFLRL